MIIVIEICDNINDIEGEFKNDVIFFYGEIFEVWYSLVFRFFG